MLPSEDLNVFAVQTELTVEGRIHAVVGQCRKGRHDHLFCGLYCIAVVRVVFVMNTEGIEDFLHVVLWRADGFELANLLHDAFSALLVERIDLEQAVAAMFQFGIQFRVEGARFCHEARECQGLRIARQHEAMKLITVLSVDTIGSRRHLFERVQRLLIPVVEDFLSAACKHRQMNLDGVFLTDPVEATDALLQQIRVQWQIEQYQMTAELEVASLAANLRAH